MRKEYEKPMIEVILFDEKDVVINLTSSSEMVTTTREDDVEIDYW